MQLSYLRLTPDARGSGSVVSFGFRGGLPGGSRSGDDRGELLNAVRAAVQVHADRRRELMERQAGAAAARDRAAQQLDLLQAERSAAEHMYGPDRDGRLAELRRQLAKIESVFHDHRVAADNAGDAITAVDAEARQAALEAAEGTAGQLAEKHRREADDLGDAIWTKIVADVATFFSLRDSVADLSDSRTPADAAAVALKGAGFLPAPRAGIMAGLPRSFSTV